MAYKDSFVDEFPYLVYSDDPEAVGGAGGGDIGQSWDPDTELPHVTNTTKFDTPMPVAILSDAQGNSIVANLYTFDEFDISKNAFMAVPKTFMDATLEVVTAPNVGDPSIVLPIGEKDADIVFNIYQLADPMAYVIRVAS